ncbi:MAG: cytochrome c maturation protein CcmE [Armatimonadetes bacterium]|nr:cytochrome c maturation protein CcmE [Armatimonadota bacterium]
MKTGAIIAVLAAGAGIGLSIYAFMAGATPYVTAREAEARAGSRVHVAGEIDHDSVAFDLDTGVLEFELVDEEGVRMPVVFEGVKPGNFDSAPTASVAGEFVDGRFHATDIKTQCPSKYESVEEGS